MVALGFYSLLEQVREWELLSNRRQAVRPRTVPVHVGVFKELSIRLEVFYVSLEKERASAALGLSGRSGSRLFDVRGPVFGRLRSERLRTMGLAPRTVSGLCPVMFHSIACPLDTTNPIARIRSHITSPVVLYIQQDVLRRFA